MVLVLFCQALVLCVTKPSDFLISILWSPSYLCPLCVLYFPVIVSFWGSIMTELHGSTHFIVSSDEFCSVPIKIIVLLRSRNKWSSNLNIHNEEWVKSFRIDVLAPRSQLWSLKVVQNFSVLPSIYEFSYLPFLSFLGQEKEMGSSWKTFHVLVTSVMDYCNSLSISSKSSLRSLQLLQNIAPTQTKRRSYIFSILVSRLCLPLKSQI